MVTDIVSQEVLENLPDGMRDRAAFIILSESFLGWDNIPDPVRSLYGHLSAKNVVVFPGENYPTITGHGSSERVKRLYEEGYEVRGTSYFNEVDTIDPERSTVKIYYSGTDRYPPLAHAETYSTQDIGEMMKRYCKANSIQYEWDGESSSTFNIVV